VAEPGLTRLAALVRGGLVESVHLGAVAVVSPDGALVARAGDPGWTTVVRSTVKPFQALPLLLAGGEERFALDDADLALICASHGGTPAHVSRARSLLERGGLAVDDLRCGAHRPIDRQAAEELDRSGELPTPLHNNCSGKHAGMLLSCRVLDLPTSDYLSARHPLQVRIAEELSIACAAGELGRPVLDGCSAPTFELSLAALARGWAAVASPNGSGAEPGHAAALGRLADAMARAPEMVAGPGRFTTDLATATAGRILGKEGAEGIYAMAIRGPHALGVAFKLADGSDRARDTVALEILLQLGVLSGTEQEGLDQHYRPVARNHRGLDVGELVAELELSD
jgi:L-asparaginase II